MTPDIFNQLGLIRKIPKDSSAAATKKKLQDISLVKYFYVHTTFKEENKYK